MMQTQIPSGLQALIQASQVLSSQASPTAPGPQGPQPTVAERVNQQIKQVAQPQMSPDIRDVGQQAGIAGQIMAQKQAQQQKVAQDPEQVAQMAAQMMKGQGVAGLPVQMGFKSGGIINFDKGGQPKTDDSGVPQEKIDAWTEKHGRPPTEIELRALDMAGDNYDVMPGGGMHRKSSAPPLPVTNHFRTEAQDRPFFGVPDVEFSPYNLAEANPQMASIGRSPEADASHRKNFAKDVALINELRGNIEKSKGRVASSADEGDRLGFAPALRAGVDEAQSYLALWLEQQKNRYGSSPIGNDPTIAEALASIPLGDPGYSDDKELAAYRKAVSQEKPTGIASIPRPAAPEQSGVASLPASRSLNPVAPVAPVAPVVASAAGAPTARPQSGVAAVAPAAVAPTTATRTATPPAAPVTPAASSQTAANQPPRGIEQIVAEDERKKRAALLPLVGELKSAEEMLRAAARSQDPKSIQTYAQKVADIRKQLEEGAKKVGVSVESVMAAAATPSAPPSATPSAPPSGTPPRTPPGTAAPTASAATNAARSNVRAGTTGQAGAPRSTQTNRPTAETEVEARTKGILSGLTEPTAATILAQANTIAPSNVDARIKEYKDLEAKRDELRGGQEELYKQAFANLQQDKDARKQLLKSREERDQFNRVMSFFRDLATNGTSYWNVQEGIFARQEADRLADFSHNKSMLELKKSQQAEKVGDVERKMSHLEKYNEWRDKAQFYTLQAADLAQRLQSNIYDRQAQARVSVADILSREKIEKERAMSESKKLGIMSQERKDAALNNRVIASQNSLINAYKVYEDAKEEHKIGLSISEEDAKKDPTAKTMRDAAIRATREAYNTVVKPALETQRRISEEVLGGRPAANRQSSTNATDPLEIRD